MRAFLVGSVVVTQALVACSSSSSGSSAGDDASIDTAVDPGSETSPGTDATGTDTSSPGTDGATGDTSTTPDAPPPIPFCVATCGTASDCATASAAFDADNYACEASTCKYTGCKTDDECKSSFASSAYACRAIAGSSVKTCVHTCSVANDCTVTPGGAYDGDNYACESGACRWKGCNTDAECKSSFAGADYVCRTLSIPGLDPLPTADKNCVKACSKASDCATASAAYDADNYACESGACRYTGCNSDAECKSSFSKPNYACR